MEISFTVLGTFLAVTCSLNIILIDEKAASIIHLCPVAHTILHLSRFVCGLITDIFLV